jgi:catalase (peroxidase I)
MLNFFAFRCRWHDAGTYDVNTRTGGANGSIRYEEEYTHGSNAGLKIAIDLLGMHYLYPITQCVSGLLCKIPF